MGFDNDVQVVVFRLNAEEYALPIHEVKDINRISEITKLPQSPAFLAGVINLREAVIPVVNIRCKLGLAEHDLTDEARIVIAELDGQNMGMIVDSVEEVIIIPGADVELPLPSPKEDTEHIVGIGKVDGRLLIILELNKLFTDEEKRVVTQVKRQWRQ